MAASHLLSKLGKKITRKNARGSPDYETYPLSLIVKQQPSLETRVPKPSRSRVAVAGWTNPESGLQEVMVNEVIPYIPCFLDSGLMSSNP